MTRPLPRAHFNSSRLVRFLTENGMLSAVQTPEDIGQKLGDWLNFRQAIALHGVLNPESPFVHAPHKPRLPAMTFQALSRHVDKVRAQLEESILQGAPPGSGLARIDMPPAELEDPVEPKTAFEPYRRFYAAHQRHMETTLHTLRSQIRSQLGKGSSAMQQLATLDAAFENILAEREAALLSKVAKLHEKRFMQAVKAHIKNLSEASSLVAAGDASTERDSVPKQTTAWLGPLRQAMRSALLAELDTRLQPTLGLLEALKQETP